MALTADQVTTLVEAARQARGKAYAPYSKYTVGAAVLTGSGSIFTGANVENAAYPSGMCAERVAVYDAVSRGEMDIRAVAVVTENGGAPCGACRQVLAEFGLQAEVLLADATGQVSARLTVSDLLPRSFGPKDLPHP
ncbi:MAG TPA: cytidine deaminase [Anaerolineales bacterium]|nr:cytidine deaminase [Anaerolineales bacterium]